MFFTPTVKNLSNFITARPPLTCLFLCIFAMGMVLIIYSGHMMTEGIKIEDPDTKLDWNIIFNGLNKLEFCLNETPNNFTTDYLEPPNERHNIKLNNYEIIHLSSMASYIPLDLFTSGNYFNTSDGKHPKRYNVKLNASDLGILPKEKPKHKYEDIWDDLSKELYVGIEFYDEYNEKDLCKKDQKTKLNKKNKYTGFGETTNDYISCMNEKLNSCVTFYVPKDLYNNTTLSNAPLSKQCNKVDRLNPINTIGSAKIVDKSLGEEYCSSRLHFKVEHVDDLNLKDYLSHEEIIKIHGRLFVSGMVLLLTFVFYIFYGSFRGSNSVEYSVF